MREYVRIIILICFLMSLHEMFAISTTSISQAINTSDSSNASVPPVTTSDATTGSAPTTAQAKPTDAQMDAVPLPDIGGLPVPTVAPGAAPRDAEGYPVPTAADLAPASNPGPAYTPASSDDATTGGSGPKTSILNQLALAKAGGPAGQAAANALGIPSSELGQGILPFIRIQLKFMALDTIANGLLALANLIKKGRKAVQHAATDVSKGIGTAKKNISKGIDVAQARVNKAKDTATKAIGNAQHKVDVVGGNKNNLNNQISKCQGAHGASISQALNDYNDLITATGLLNQDEALQTYIKENNPSAAVVTKMKAILQSNIDNATPSVKAQMQKLQAYAESSTSSIERPTLTSAQMTTLKAEMIPLLNGDQLAALQNELDATLAAFDKDTQDLINKNRPWLFQRQLGYVHSFATDKKITIAEELNIENYVRKQYVLDINLGDVKKNPPKKHWYTVITKVASDVGKAFKTAASDVGKTAKNLAHGHIKGAIKNVGSAFKSVAKDTIDALESVADCVAVVGQGTAWASRQATENVAKAALEVTKKAQQLALDSAQAELEVNKQTAKVAVTVGGGVAIGALQVTQGVMLAVEEIDKGIAEAILKAFQIKEIYAFIGIGASLKNSSETEFPNFDVKGVIVGKNFNISIDTKVFIEGVEGVVKSIWKKIRKAF